MSIRKKIFQGLTWTFSSHVVNVLFSIVKISILTRFLDKADFGLMAIMMVVIGLFNLVLDIGISIGILHYQQISIKAYSSLYWVNMEVV